MDGVRYLKADRSQLSWDLLDLEALLAADHRARVVWAFVETLDLRVFYAAIRSLEGGAGRPPADPKVLLALWLYATLEGVGSARELDRLVTRDLAYRWLAGGVPMNYHGLADFRVDWADELDRLLTESVTALMAEGLVSLEEIAVDGTKVRASAGAGSYTRGGRLERLEAAAKARIEALKAEVQADPAAASRRKQAAQARAAREVVDKAAKARAALEKLRKEKQAREKTHGKEEKARGEPSVSLSDLEARRMRFADGQVRPAYNIQTAAEPLTGVVVSVSASERRNDQGLALPMLEALAGRYGRTPRRLLLDQGYASQDDIVAAEAHPQGAVTVYSPPPDEKPDDELKPGGAARRRAKRAKEPDAVKAWRARMQTDEARQIFRRRKLIERVHAHYKNRGMGVLTVRGRLKAWAVALWHALANNLITAHRLRTAAA
jgi:transposase